MIAPAYEPLLYFSTVASGEVVHAALHFKTIPVDYLHAVAGHLQTFAAQIGYQLRPVAASGGAVDVLAWHCSAL
jgi:hypothetical protein